MEKIWGPVNAFYVAAYAAQVGDENRWASYAKICFAEPFDYWEAECVFKLFGGERHFSADAALLAVQRLAYAHIARIPPSAVTLLDIAVQEKNERMLVPIGNAIRARVQRSAMASAAR